jgi:hypothetical protein
MRYFSVGNSDSIQRTTQTLGEWESFLRKDFETTDLGILQQSFIQSHQVIRESFVRTPFWKLFWNCDYFVDEIKNRLRNHGLIQAEYQVG